jgi:hypothetical protein
MCVHAFVPVTHYACMCFFWQTASLFCYFFSDNICHTTGENCRVLSDHYVLQGNCASCGVIWF